MTPHTDTIDHIDHRATVVGIDREQCLVTVSVADASDCAACPAARLCGITDNKSRRLTVWCRDAESLKEGQSVILRGTEQMHRRAIMLATVLPCIFLIAAMTFVFVLTGSQLAAALTGLGSMLFFFGAIYLMRNHVAHEFSFVIVSADEDSGNPQ